MVEVDTGINVRLTLYQNTLFSEHMLTPVKVLKLLACKSDVIVWFFSVIFFLQIINFMCEKCSILLKFISLMVLSMGST